MPIPCEMATEGAVRFSFSPFTQISPLVGCSRPKSIFISVRFTCAVLAHQRVNFALSQGKVHALVGGDAVGIHLS